MNSALKSMKNIVSNDVLPLDDLSLSELNKSLLLRGEKPSVCLAVFEDIDQIMVKDAAFKTKVVMVLNELRNYGTINVDLRKAFANVIKKISTEKLPVE